jgi:hypothetical protein
MMRTATVSFALASPSSLSALQTSSNTIDIVSSLPAPNTELPSLAVAPRTQFLAFLPSHGLMHFKSLVEVYSRERLLIEVSSASFLEMCAWDDCGPNTLAYLARTPPQLNGGAI